MYVIVVYENRFVKTDWHQKQSSAILLYGAGKSCPPLSIRHGIKFTAGNIGVSDNIYTFPYFCAFLLKDYLKRF